MPLFPQPQPTTTKGQTNLNKQRHHVRTQATQQRRNTIHSHTKPIKVQHKHTSNQNQRHQFLQNHHREPQQRTNHRLNRRQPIQTIRREETKSQHLTNKHNTAKQRPQPSQLKQSFKRSNRKSIQRHLSQKQQPHHSHSNTQRRTNRQP